MRTETSARAKEKGLVNSRVTIICSATLLVPETCRNHRGEEHEGRKGNERRKDECGP